MANELKFKGMGYQALLLDVPGSNWPTFPTLGGVADLGNQKVALLLTEYLAPTGAGAERNWKISIRVIDLKGDLKVPIHTQDYHPVTAPQSHWAHQGDGDYPDRNDPIFAQSTQYLGDGRCVVLWNSFAGQWAQMDVMRWNGTSVDIGPPVILVDPEYDWSGYVDADEPAPPVGSDPVSFGGWGDNFILQHRESNPNAARVALGYTWLVKNGSDVIVALSNDDGTPDNIQAFRHYKIDDLTITTDGAWKWPLGPTPHTPDPGREHFSSVGDVPHVIMNGRWLSLFGKESYNAGARERIVMSRCNIDTLEVINQVVDDDLVPTGIAVDDIIQPEQAGAAGVYVGAARVSRDFKVSGRYLLQSALPERRPDPHMNDSWRTLSDTMTQGHAEGSNHSGMARGSALMMHYAQFGGGPPAPGEPHAPPGQGHQSGWAIMCQLGHQNGYGELAVAPDRGTFHGEDFWAGDYADSEPGWEVDFPVDSYLVTDRHVIGFCYYTYNQYLAFKPLNYDPAYFYPTYYVFERPFVTEDIAPGKNIKQGHFL